MRLKKLSFLFLAAGFVLLIVVGIFVLLPAQPVSAQCGSQASSCKNCHETQAQDPVNNDQTTWHSQHAFGDFCYLCHGGNNQATDETAAHAGMVSPLDDIVVACKSCHTKDYQALAQGYADTLGVKIGTGVSQTQQGTGQTTVSSSAVATIAPAAAIPAADMVDFSQRYDEVALGKKPANVGNIILTVLIAALLLGGGYLVARREGWVKISFQETKTIQGSYPADVVDMVPEIAKLKPSIRNELSKILKEPSTVDDFISFVSKQHEEEVESTTESDSVSKQHEEEGESETSDSQPAKPPEE